MEPNSVIGIDPELARVLILIGLVATVGALLIAVATVVISIHVAFNVYTEMVPLLEALATVKERKGSLHGLIWSPRGSLLAGDFSMRSVNGNRQRKVDSISAGGGSEKTINTDKPIAFYRLGVWSLDGTEIVGHPESSFVGLT